MKSLSVDAALNLRLESGYILIILAISGIGDAAYLYSIKEFEPKTFETLYEHMGGRLVSKVFIRIHPVNDAMAYEYTSRNSIPEKPLREFLRLAILIASVKAHKDNNLETAKSLVGIYIATMNNG